MNSNSNTQNQNTTDMSSNRMPYSINDPNLIIQTIGPLITEYNENINYYNSNINYYNSNIRQLINILQPNVVYNDDSIRSQRNVRNSAFTIPNIGRNVIYESILHRPNTDTSANRGNYRNVFQNMMEDVVVRPTAEQLTNALEDISYNGTGASCPITLEPFETGEIICKIIHCSHIFKRTALYDWFSRNVRCPICRYDIREYVSPSPSSTSTSNLQNENSENEETKSDTQNTNSIMNEIIDQIFPQENNQNTENHRGLRTFTGVLQRFLQRELQNNPEFRDISFDITF
jgi:hypothetical protein